MNMLAAIPDVQELCPTVIRVLGQNPGPMTLQGTNCYLLHQPQDYASFTLIDAGSPAPLAELFVPKLLEAMRSAAGGSSNSDNSNGQPVITDIVLTHYHADHIGGLSTLLTALRESQPGTFPRVHKYPIPRDDALSLKDDELIEAIPEDSVRRSDHGESIHWLKDGDVIPIGSGTTSTGHGPAISLKVIHTPGHTPDSISLLVRSVGSTSPPPADTVTILFSADTILGQSTTIFTDLTAYLSSLHLLRALDVDAIFPGHGPVIQGREACVDKIDGYIKHRMDREAQILLILNNPGYPEFVSDQEHSVSDRGWTIRQIVQKLYTGVNEGERVWRAAEAPVKAHLEKLERDGRIGKAVSASKMQEEMEASGERRWVLLSLLATSQGFSSSDASPSSNFPTPIKTLQPGPLPKLTSCDRPPRSLHNTFTLDAVCHLLGKTVFSPVLAGGIALAMRLKGGDSEGYGIRIASGWGKVVVTSRIILHLGRIYNSGFSFLIRPKKIVWADQVVVITGGASGIGALLAEEIAARGGRAAVLDINLSASTSHNISSYKVDVSNCQAVQEAAKRIRDEVGPPTILVNNAGVMSGRLILDLDERDVRRTFDVNVLSHFWTLKAFLPDLIEKKAGHVVTVGSVLGVVGSAQMTDYCASKAALLNLHESLRFELRNRYHIPAIRTTLILPGHTSTSLFAALRLPTSPFFRFLAPTLTPSDVVQAIVSALEDQESRVIRLPVYTNVARLMGVGAGLIPWWMKDLAQWMSGADTAMEAYGGR